MIIALNRPIELIDSQLLPNKSWYHKDQATSWTKKAPATSLLWKIGVLVFAAVQYLWGLV